MLNARVIVWLFRFRHRCQVSFNDDRLTDSRFSHCPLYGFLGSKENGKTV